MVYCTANTLKVRDWWVPHVRGLFFVRPTNPLSCMRSLESRREILVLVSSLSVGSLPPHFVLIEAACVVSAEPQFMIGWELGLRLSSLAQRGFVRWRRALSRTRSRGVSLSR